MEDTLIQKNTENPTISSSLATSSSTSSIIPQQSFSPIEELVKTFQYLLSYSNQSVENYLPLIHWLVSNKEYNNYSSLDFNSFYGTYGFIFLSQCSVQRDLLLNTFNSSFRDKKTKILCCNELILLNFFNLVVIMNEIMTSNQYDFVIINNIQVLFTNPSTSSSNSSSTFTSNFTRILLNLIDYISKNGVKTKIILLSEKFIPSSFIPCELKTLYRLGSPYCLSPLLSNDFYQFFNNLIEVSFRNVMINYKEEKNKKLHSKMNEESQSELETEDIREEEKLKEIFLSIVNKSLTSLRDHSLTLETGLNLIQNSLITFYTQYSSTLNSSSPSPTFFSSPPIKQPSFSTAFSSSKRFFGNKKNIEKLNQFLNYNLLPSFPFCLTPSGILIKGSSGSGKTFLFEYIKKNYKIKYTIKDIYTSDLLNKIIGESEKRIYSLFNEAKEKSPSIIFIDNLDILLNEAASGHPSDPVARAVSCILSQMDRVNRNNKSPSDCVVVIAAITSTNNLSNSVTRSGRFEELITIEEPTEKEREEFINSLFIDYIGEERMMKIDQNLLTDLIKKTEKMYFGEIKNLIQEKIFFYLNIIISEEIEKKERKEETEDKSNDYQNILGDYINKIIEDCCSSIKSRIVNQFIPSIVPNFMKR